MIPDQLLRLFPEQVPVVPGVLLRLVRNGPGLGLGVGQDGVGLGCLLYTSPSPRDA